jgi:hypothetical protein
MRACDGSGGATLDESAARTWQDLIKPRAAGMARQIVMVLESRTSRQPQHLKKQNTFVTLYS